MLPWIHPHLAQSVDPHKGRQLQASATIRRGEVVLIDPPYAIIPVLTVDKNKDTLLCSNPQCNSPVSVSQSTKLAAPESRQGATCPNRCSPDVLWCHDVCRLTDKARHDFECTWLSRFSRSIRLKWGEYNFGMLWLIVRLLARRHTEHLHLLHHEKNIHPASPLNRFKANWPAMQSLCGTPDTWSNAQVREWTLLVRKYLSTAVLPHDLSNETVLGLICQEEANSFGLYPRETGVYPPPNPNPPVNRGEQFGAAVYPRASIANHSCCPNIIHKPDTQARMIFTAGREISPGEECCIVYFDLAEKVSLQERREHLSSLFRFRCGCARCSDEEGEGGPNLEEGRDSWDMFPVFE